MLSISLFLKTKFGKHTTRTILLLIIGGIAIEILVAVSGVVIRQLFSGGWEQAPLFADHRELYRPFLIANSIVGFSGAMLLSYGIISLINNFRLSKQSGLLVYVALFTFMSYKAFDILQTFHWLYLREILGLGFDLDIILSNLLLVGSAMIVLAGMMRALYDASRSSLRLERQNTLLDREVEERHRSEIQAKTSEERLAAILNALSAPVFLCDIEGYVLAHNHVFSRVITGATKSLVGKHLYDLLPKNIFEVSVAHAMKVFELSQADDFMLANDDRQWHVIIYPVPTENHSIPCITVVAHDMTEELRNEEERRLLETAITHAAESIMVTDVNGHIEYVNPAFEEQTGYARYEVMGRNPSFLKSGKQDDLYYRTLWATIKKGEVWRGRFINRHKNGSLFHENATLSPIINGKGIITHFVAVKRNVTREHELEMQLQQAQKIEALGTLAGGIAHDLNNVLAIILGRSELIMEMLETGHPARDSLTTIMRTATRSSKLIKRLLTFTRQSVGETGPLYVASLLKEQIKVIRSLFPSNIMLVERILVDKAVITADPGEIQQIVVNLLVNANHAMQPVGGSIEIGLETVYLEGPRVTFTGVLNPGAHICLRVRDTGCGMDTALLDHIFEPFFTTKDVGEGTGLGLSMVHGSVLRSGGQIDVDTAPGEGSCFYVYWPEALSKEVSDPVPTERINGSGISVLIIDDLTDFTDLLTLNLQNYGYRVTAFSEPQAAIEHFQNDGSNIDIAVVDYMMPKMNGQELAHAMHALRPDLPIVLLTGYATGITSENAAHHGFCAMFEKPVEIERLSRSLATLARSQQKEDPPG